MSLQDSGKSLVMASRDHLPNRLLEQVGNAGQGRVDDQHPITGLNPLVDQVVDDLPTSPGRHTAATELQHQPAPA